MAKTQLTSRASKPAPPAQKAEAKPKSARQSGAASQRAAGQDASRLIDERIRSLADWRGETLAAMRRLILAADPEIREEWKWMGTPVWSRAGNICTGETYKQVVKLTFARGAALKDPRGLFNSSLEGNTRRAIDIHKGETVNAAAFKALVQAAVAENLRLSAGKSKPPAKRGAPSTAGTVKATPATTSPGNATKPRKAKTKTKTGTVLLAGGNPQIAKGEGAAPVAAYLAALTGWKQDLGKQLDALIMKCVPGVRKAVKWNSPFYGVEGQGWFLSFHVFTRYVKVTFFRATTLRPVPPGGTGKEARWIDIHEQDFDATQMTKWIKQAAAQPGWMA